MAKLNWGIHMHNMIKYKILPIVVIFIQIKSIKGLKLSVYLASVMGKEISFSFIFAT